VEQKSRPVFGLAALVLVLVSRPAVASPVVIHFDDLSDSDIITTQYPGLTFSNAVAFAAGISLNELEFPPLSGSNVASDNGGPMSIAFAQPVSNVGGYFTYAEPLSLEAFSATNTLLGSVSSLFSSNLALSGDTGSSPNEFLQLAFTGISSVTFTGDPLGGSFTLDDLTYTPNATPSPVPEPGTLSLMLLGGFGYIRSRYSQHRSRHVVSVLKT
jgi:hypothetical protein